MKRTFHTLIVALGLISLPLFGCGEDNEKTAGLTGTPPIDKPGDDTSPEGRKKQMKGLAPGGKSAGGQPKNYPGPRR